ncbi:PREDICTED: uncharacterized protein LOC104768201 [Camelina sativa]|uniref:Uncharacterized protein LOC104768201 n=1 Tax=Camelina sativa TaxID=90675 RepID=A0ABM0XSL9_CAMSA|nr:PREDICTED: uncharacterized protein LOC104768201 [Camelina sativa]
MAREEFANGEIHVFWDVNDFPVPENRSIREIVDSLLRRYGYKGEVTITAYGENYPEDDPLESGITFVAKRDKSRRLHRILVDFALVASDNHEPHRIPLTLMVVAKNIKEENEFHGLLQSVNAANYNVLLVLPDVYDPKEVALPYVNFAWRWTSLVDGGDPIPKPDFFALLDEGGRRVILCANYSSEDEVYNEDDSDGEGF